MGSSTIVLVNGELAVGNGSQGGTMSDLGVQTGSWPYPRLKWFPAGLGSAQVQELVAQGHEIAHMPEVTGCADSLVAAGQSGWASPCSMVNAWGSASPQALHGSQAAAWLVVALESVAENLANRHEYVHTQGTQPTDASDPPLAEVR
jgi:hypothetical protein